MVLNLPNPGINSTYLNWGTDGDVTGTDTSNGTMDVSGGDSYSNDELYGDDPGPVSLLQDESVSNELYSGPQKLDSPGAPICYGPPPLSCSRTPAR
jgi:hypothetical protein